MTELEHLESKIREERKECERIRRDAKNEELAKTLRGIYDKLIESGFSEGQAFGILMETIKAAWNS
ncbi:MAG: hypothetical protein J6R54_01945 [Bacteroidaceae bacterium]|nr:hypothetical protein [Bacteroidaceae bacterium]